MSPSQSELAKMKWYRILQIIAIIAFGVSVVISILVVNAKRPHEKLTMQFYYVCDNGKKYTNAQIDEIIRVKSDLATFNMTRNEKIRSICDIGRVSSLPYVGRDYKMKRASRTVGSWPKALFYGVGIVILSFIIIVSLKYALLYVLYGKEEIPKTIVRK